MRAPMLGPCPSAPGYRHRGWCPACTAPMRTAKSRTRGIMNITPSSATNGCRHNYHRYEVAVRHQSVPASQLHAANDLSRYRILHIIHTARVAAATPARFSYTDGRATAFARL